MTKQFLTPISVYSSLGIDGAAGTYRTLLFSTNGIQRWALNADTASEAGSNTGSELQLASFDDAGNYITTVVSFDRATGVTTFLHPPVVPTQSPGDNTTKAASTAFVTAAVTAGGGGGGGGALVLGTTDVDFGTTPVEEAVATVTGQAAILSTSRIACWVQEEATGTNDAQSHRQLAMAARCFAQNVVAGVGFDICVSLTMGLAVDAFTIHWNWI